MESSKTIISAAQEGPSSASEAVAVVRSPTIGFVSPIFGAEMPQACFRGIDRTARRRGARVLTAGAKDSLALEKATVLELIASGVDGLVIYPTLRGLPGEADEYLDELPPDFPIVLVDTCFPGQGRAQVIFDNRRAAYQITRHLLSGGSQRVAFLTYAHGNHHPAIVARRRGFREAIREFDPDAEEIVRALSVPQLYGGLDAILDELLKGDQPVDAFIGVNDVMAMETIECLRRRGVAVPEQVAVAGFDYSLVTAQYRPIFTTTEPDFALMGEVAAEILLDALETGSLLAQTYLLPAPLRVRHDFVGA